MTSALRLGCVDDAVNRMRAVGLYPFAPMDATAGYGGMKMETVASCHVSPTIVVGIEPHLPID